MTSIANGLVTRGYSKVGTNWASTELPKLGGFRVRRRCIPAYPSLQALHTGVSGTPIGTPSGMARWTSHGSRLHVFSRLFASFRVFALSQEKHLQVGARVLKLLESVLMCALILWVPGWTPGLWLDQWVTKFAIHAHMQSILKTGPIRIPKLYHNVPHVSKHHQTSGSPFEHNMPRILDPIAAISIHDKKPRALKDKGCQSPGLFLGVHGPSLWPWVHGSWQLSPTPKILQLLACPIWNQHMLDHFKEPSPWNISNSNPHVSRRRDLPVRLSASHPDPALGLGDQWPMTGWHHLPCCLASRSIWNCSICWIWFRMISLFSSFFKF